MIGVHNNGDLCNTVDTLHLILFEAFINCVYLLKSRFSKSIKRNKIIDYLL